MNQKQADDLSNIVRKKGKFFLMKNTNANENYQNHSYFSRDKLKKQSDDNIPSKFKNVKIDRQFVDGSASFGVDNTYKYLWNKSDIKERLKAQSKQRVKYQKSRYQKSTNLQAIPLFSVQTESRNNFRIYAARKSSRNYETTRTRIKTEKTLTSVERKNKSLSSILLPSFNELETQKISLPICFIYASNIKNYQQISNRTMQINFSNYLIKLFIKCKINWKTLESSDFQEILRIIKIARQNTQKIEFSTKDIVNMRTVAEIFNHLANYKQGSNEWLGTVRYFFLSNNDKIQEFLFERFKDEIKIFTTSKLNLQFQNDELHFYNFYTGVQVKGMFEFINCNKFVYDQSIAGFQSLKAIIKGHDQQIMLKERIKRWKSILPLDQDTCENKKKEDNIRRIEDKNKTFLTLDQVSYNKLYERYKIKHAKVLTKPKKDRQARSQWIQRQKLIKNPDIFE